MSYKLIPEDEDALLELADLPFLVVGPEWQHADVMIFDPIDLCWYSPVDGSESFPNPTHYMEIPKL